VYPMMFLLYVVAEIAVLAWLGSTLGALTTVLIFLGVSIAGYLVLAARGRRALRSLSRLRSGPALSASPEQTLTDGLLTGLGAALVLVPGLITTLLGVVLLLPTRAAARPLVRAAVARRATKRGFSAGGFSTQRLVIVDGQVVDHSVVGAAPHLTAGPVPTSGEAPVLEGEIVDTPRPRDGR